MPAYNEEENIRKVIESWYSILSGKDPRSKLVVADSGSTDKTHAILEELKTSFPNLEILTETGRQHGPKLMALYNYAIKNGADYIFQTDSDGQTNPAEFETFWNIRSQYAAIIGDRKGREDGKARVFVEWVVCLLLRLYFRVKVPDANAPFRLMKTDLVKKYLYRLPEEYGLPNIMLTTYFVFYKEHVKFEKISFSPRQGGENSINIPRIIKIGWKALYDFGSLRKNMGRRPT